MTRAGAAIVAAMLLVSGSASGAEERPWSLSVGAGYVVLGPSERTTGGIAPSIGGTYTWSIGERWRAALGAGATAFGFASDGKWLGMLAGPAGGMEVLPTESMRLGLLLAGDMGRIPVCNDWGICLRYWGLFPRAAFTAGYDISPTVGVSAIVSARYVSTLAWSGASFEPAVSGRFSW